MFSASNVAKYSQPIKVSGLIERARILLRPRFDQGIIVVSSLYFKEMLMEISTVKGVTQDSSILQVLHVTLIVMSRAKLSLPDVR